MQNIMTIGFAALVLLASVTAGAASLEEQKQLSARAIEMWGNNNLDLVDQTLAPDYINHQAPDVEGGTKTLDLASWQELLRGFHEGFADTEVEILMQVAEGDLVATRWRFVAKQTGTYLGLAPTGKTISWTGIQIDRFDDGKIAETWVNWDMYHMFEQLGLLK
ncbi:MAG: ester cyclase [Pseudomonadota bacterium]